MVPNIKKKYKSKVVLLNFLYGVAKLAIWCKIRNKVKGRENVDAVMKRLMMEYAYFNLINDVNYFFHVWGVDGFICEADDQGGFVFNL